MFFLKFLSEKYKTLTIFNGYSSTFIVSKLEFVAAEVVSRKSG